MRKSITVIVATLALMGAAPAAHGMGETRHEQRMQCIWSTGEPGVPPATKGERKARRACLRAWRKTWHVHPHHHNDRDHDGDRDDI